MELFPIGPITIVDTPGLEDTSELKDERLKITTNNLKISDVAILVISDGIL
jgi:predicted GTPase